MIRMSILLFTHTIHVLCSAAAIASSAASHLSSMELDATMLKRALKSAERKMGDRAQIFLRQADDAETVHVLSTCSDTALHLALDAMKTQVGWLAKSLEGPQFLLLSLCVSFCEQSELLPISSILLGALLASTAFF